MVNKDDGDFLVIIITFALIVLIVFGCCTIFEEPLDKVFNEAMIIQPDNTLVIGDLTAYSTVSDGRMYKLSMSNGKTYLVPYSRIILIQTD